MTRPLRLLAAAFCLLPTVFTSLHAAPPPELTLLRQQYDKVYSEQVTAPYDAGLSELNTRYVGGLDWEEDTPLPIQTGWSNSSTRMTKPLIRELVTTCPEPNVVISA